MIQPGTPNPGRLVSRSVLAVALALGVVVGATATAPVAVAAPKPPKMSFSKGFVAVAGPLQKAIEDAKKRADVAAAKAELDAAAQANNAAGANAARAKLATALAPEKAQLDQAFAAIANEDDRFMYGTMAIGLGGFAADNALQRKGLDAMITSGKGDPAQLPRFHYFAGSLAYQDKDFASAQSHLQSAVDAGFYENNSEAILAESFIGAGNPAKGLGVLKAAIDRAKAAGTPAPAAWYRRGLGASYNAKMPGEAAEFAMRLVDAYPNKDNWGGAITVVREIGKFGAQETLDLMRLMSRTDSYAEERDYIEYIQAADPRRLPGEVAKVIEAGIASGKLRAGDAFISDARTQASGRIAADKASLASYTADARKAGATEATVSGAADALLSYGEYAQAAELYNAALGKPGVDAARALTRLGIAQVGAGDYAGAQATFAKVTGPRQSIAKLWAIYAAQKAKGG